MYFPHLDMVMKCGGDDDVTTIANQDSMATASLAGSVSWTVRTSIPGGSRVFHNLTVLPDGRVMLTGGRTHRSTLPTNFTKIPRLWDPSDPTVWPDDDLAPDLASRGYHSNALLLPDARVLTAGGPAGNNMGGDLRATVFSPPYLFRNGNQPAERPAITSAPELIHYGEPFYIGVSSAAAAKMVSLIRPGSATHAFDQNQRFVPLAFTKYLADQRLRATLTFNPNEVPPGDYLLFVVDSTASGNVPSVARWVRIASEIDGATPASAPLTYSNVTGTSAMLLWTAPGDDGTAGTASLYDLRYRTGAAITAANFASCTTLTTYPPRPSNSQEQYAVLDLKPCTIYFFGLKTRDEHGNWSALTTVPIGTLGCGGGGGGEYELSARPVGGSSSPVSQRVAVALGRSNETTVGFTLTHIGSVPITVDSLRAVSVRVGEDSLAVPSSGEVVSGGLVPALRIETLDRNDVTNHVLGGGYSAAAGESLVVRFEPHADPSVGWTLVVEAPDRASEAPGGVVHVLEPDGRGGWIHRARTFVAAGLAGIVGDVFADSLCLTFDDDLVLGGVRRLIPAPAPAPEPVDGGTWSHSGLGTTSGGVQGAVSLAPGEAMDYRLPVTAAADAVFLLFRSTAAGASPERIRRSIDRTLPTSFALGQNEPNPFGEGTRIRFALPLKSQVAIEVFDLHGRRIRTLARGELQAGDHAVTWDRRDEHGRRVGTGVYLYRMTAGSFRASRKLTVLP